MVKLILFSFLWLQKHVAESLYLLYQSIKIQVEKGPVDIITGQSYFCLNFDCLMEENIEFNERVCSTRKVVPPPPPPLSHTVS